MFKGLTITARGQRVLNVAMAVTVWPAVVAVGGGIIGLLFAGCYDLGTILGH